VTAAKAVNYTNAGTVEFLIDEGAKFHFLEMNTRLQVEHLITEMVTGIDVVKEQIRIASGEPLKHEQGDITINGHAINCRINAEDPDKDFAPCPGTISAYRAPGGPGVRVDSALYRGYTIPVFYDSLIAKLAVWDRNRQETIQRMRHALEEIQIEGVETTISLHKRILEDEHFVKGRINTSFVQDRIERLAIKAELRSEDIAALVAALTFSTTKTKPHIAVIPRRKTTTRSEWRSFQKERLQPAAFRWSG